MLQAEPPGSLAIVKQTSSAHALEHDTYVSVTVVVRRKPIRLRLHVDEDGGYWVDSPDMKGLVTQGDTTDEAIANGLDAALTLMEGTAKLKKRRRP